MSDQRADIYQDLHGRFTREEQVNHASAERVLGLLFERFRPASVLDVGCGIGTWLNAAQQLGIADVRGIEGAWLDPTKIVVDPSLIETRELEQSFSLGRTFDLVMCLEVAEHLSAAAAEPFVRSLTSHADVILFSAAIPHQGGHHHVNEQFPNYWADLFGARGFTPLDFIRPQIWLETANVHWWLVQNAIVFANERAMSAHPKLSQPSGPAPLSVVHPSVYQTRLHAVQQQLVQQQALIQYLTQGGTFDISVTADGKLNVRKH